VDGEQLQHYGMIDKICCSSVRDMCVSAISTSGRRNTNYE